VRVRLHRYSFYHLFLRFHRTLLLAWILSFQAGAVIDVVLKLFDWLVHKAILFWWPNVHMVLNLLHGPRVLLFDQPFQRHELRLWWRWARRHCGCRNMTASLLCFQYYAWLWWDVFALGSQGWRTLSVGLVRPLRILRLQPNHLLL